MADHQAPPSLGFSRQEHWNGLPFPSPMQGKESRENEYYETSQWMVTLEFQEVKKIYRSNRNG